MTSKDNDRLLASHRLPVRSMRTQFHLPNPWLGYWWSRALFLSLLWPRVVIDDRCSRRCRWAASRDLRWPSPTRHTSSRPAAEVAPLPATLTLSGRKANKFVNGPRPEITTRHPASSWRPQRLPSVSGWNTKAEATKRRWVFSQKTLIKNRVIKWINRDF